MPLLSRKRKRKGSQGMDSPNVNSTSHLMNTSEAELSHAEDNSRLSSNILVDISLNENFNKSQSQTHNSVSQRADPLSAEPMDTQITDGYNDYNEELSNRWADDVNSSQTEPTETQFERDIRDQVEDEISRAKLNIAECGTIESITLVNFMCHSHFYLDFGPRINFIVGRNGSGKSAILTAIVLGFGGRASTTSRGKGIVSFIKCGETQSKIILKICNSDKRSNGGQAFNFEDYGKSIVIERTINASGGSTYKLKSAAGKVIAERKDVLDELIRHFNIQVDNPICVLNQEVSRNFLNTKNPRDKYTFFMKATLLEDMKNNYAESDTKRSVSSRLLDEKQKVIPELMKDLKKLEQKIKMFKDLEDYNEKFVRLNCEALWALIYEQKSKMDSIKAQISKYEKKMESEMTQMNAKKDVIKNLETNKTDLETQLNTLLGEVGRGHSFLEELKVKSNGIRDQIRDKEKEKRSVESELISAKKDVQRLESKIVELNQQFSDESHNNRKLQISELKEQIEKLREEEETLLAKDRELNQITHQLGEERVKISQDLNQLKTSISSKVREIDRLNQSRTERLQRFGPKYPELVKSIEEAHRRGRFKHKPLGPIGNHIQLRDYSCALAVELCLKRNLFAFCCDNLEDQKVLKAIIDRVFGNERKPPIITRPFVPLHDVSQHRVRSNEYQTFLDLMLIKDQPIANCLIDLLRIEQILYIPDYKRAENLLINRQTAPHNCYQAYTQDGSVMTPSTSHQDYRCYANNTNKRNASILMKNVDQILAALKDEQKGLEGQHRLIQQTADENKRAIDSRHTELRAIEQRKKQIRGQLISNDTKLKELEAIGDSPPVEISTLEEQLQTYTEKKSGLDERLQTVKNEREELNQLYTEVDNEFTDKKREYDSLMAKRHPMKERMESIDSELKNHSIIFDKYEKQYNDTKAQKEEEDRHLAAKEDEYRSDEQKALEKTSGKQIETNRSSKTITNEIKQLEKFLDEQENTIGNRDDIFSQHNELCTHFKRVIKEVQSLERHLKLLVVSLALRRKGYIELRNFYSMMTKFFFMDALKCKKFSGSLDIYHSEKEVNGELKKGKTLEIRVNPKSDDQNSQSISASMNSNYSDTRSLSGGERSYSTVAFILALWESAQSPFKILDEVDVFMDMVTRQISLDAMVEFAAQKSGKQYIFLSPLKMQRLPSPELIKIFQMPEPRRNDQ